MSAIGKEHEMWPPLAESTIRDKQRHGFPTPKPLLRTGEMRDNVESTVVSDHEGAVGSDLEHGRKSFTSELAEEIGTEAAAVIVDALVRSAMTEKHKLEASCRGAA